MKITVITVAYNSAATIERTMSSVAEQTYSDIEHWVIDGASNDQTVEIVQEHATVNTRIISEPDRGIYDAMNKGLDLATGDIICFLNADDQYASNTVLSRVVVEMRKYRLDALLGDVGFFHEGCPDRIVRRYRSDRFTPERLAWGWMPAHPALFLSREVVKRVGHFKTEYRIAGDFDFVVRAFHGRCLRYRHTPEVLVRMQIGGASTSGWRAKILLNKEVLRACRENGVQTNMMKILSKYPVKLFEKFNK